MAREKCSLLGVPRTAPVELTRYVYTAHVLQNWMQSTLCLRYERLVACTELQCISTDIPLIPHKNLSKWTFNNGKKPGSYKHSHVLHAHGWVSEWVSVCEQEAKAKSRKWYSSRKSSWKYALTTSPTPVHVQWRGFKQWWSCCAVCNGAHRDQWQFCS